MHKLWVQVIPSLQMHYQIDQNPFKEVFEYLNMHDSGWNVQKIANLNELKNGSAIEITYIQTKLYSYVNIFFLVLHTSILEA